MADIIPLSPHARRGAQTSMRRPGPGASIVIFPGIRYERPHEDASGDEQPAAMKRKRQSAERSKSRA